MKMFGVAFFCILMLNTGSVLLVEVDCMLEELGWVNIRSWQIVLSRHSLILSYCILTSVASTSASLYAAHQYCACTTTYFAGFVIHFDYKLEQL